MTTILLRKLCALLFVTILTAPLLRAQQEAPEFNESPSLVAPNTWRLTWASAPGRSYRLERSLDLKTWTEVDTIVADAASTILDDDGLTDEQLAFWRIVDVTSGGAGPEILDLNQGFAVGGNPWLTTEIPSSSPLVSVVFYDGDTLLGEALRQPDADDT